MQGGVQITRPDPDPTTLTTAALLREVGMLREIVAARLDGMDKAIELTQQYPTLLDKAIVSLTELVRSSVGTLKDLHGERFNAIAVQFAERDVRLERTSQDRKDAIYAELQSQKDAVRLLNESNGQAIAKSEAAFAKQIDALEKSQQANAKAADDKISYLKDRLTAIESKSQGAGNLWALIVGGVFLLIAGGGVFAALLKGSP